MNNFKEIRPAPAVLGHSTHFSASLIHQADAPLERSAKRKKHRHDGEEWLKYKEVIIQAYAAHKLEDVIRLVNQRFGFEASLRRYRDKLREWGVEKNYPADVLQYVTTKQEQRMREKGIGTVFIYRGLLLDPAVIERFHNRQQYPSQAFTASPLKVTPDTLQYYTPSTPLMSTPFPHGTPQVFTPLSKLSEFAVNSYHKIRSTEDTNRLLHWNSTEREIRYLFVCLNSTFYGSQTDQSGKDISDCFSTPRSTSPVNDDRLELMLRTSDACSGPQSVLPRAGQPVINEGQDSYDVTSTRIARRRRREERRKILPELPSRLTDHQHRVLENFAIGTGHFIHKSVLWPLFDPCIDLAKAINSWSLGSTFAKPDSLMAFSDEISNPTRPQCYLFSSEERLSDLSIDPLLYICRNSDTLQRMSGLSQDDLCLWFGPWGRMTDEKAHLFNETAICLFGDPSLSYPDTNHIVLLVILERHSVGEDPMLLRLFLAVDGEPSIAKCGDCAANPFIVDCKSRLGSVRLQTDAKFDHVDGSLEDLETGTHKFYTISYIFSTKWSLAAYYKQGFSTDPQIWKCRCNGSVHQRGFRPHYLDLCSEYLDRQEDWHRYTTNDPAPDYFSPFPASKFVLEIARFENQESSVGDRSDWDPTGSNASDLDADDFQPFPLVDIDAQDYLSKVKFL